MPVSAMQMTGGVVFYNYFCGGNFFVTGVKRNIKYGAKALQKILIFQIDAAVNTREDSGYLLIIEL